MSLSNRILKSATRALTVAFGLVAVTAHADDDPMPSATVLWQADLENRRIITLGDIAAGVPELSSTPSLNSLSTLSLYMRGEGPVAADDVTLDGAVGIYEDGFYVARLQANTFDLLDLERVEVLAGPQGALFGRNTPGGVINLVSQSPTGKLDFDESVDFGNQNSYRVSSSIDAPRWHGLAARVTGVVSGIDGYVKNASATEHGYGEDKQRAARLQLLWDGIASLRARYFIERSGLDSTPEYDTNPGENGTQLYPGYAYYANPRGPMSTTYRPIELALSTSNHTAQGLTLTWTELPALTIESLTGYRTLSANEYQDYAEFFAYPEFALDAYRQHQFSQDLHFSGELFDHQLDYRVGATYFREIGRHIAGLDFYTIDTSQLRIVSAATHSQSLFAELHWRPGVLRDRLELSAAARRTRESKDADRTIIIDQSDVSEADGLSHISYNRTNPEGVVTWHWTDSLVTYAKVATAFESGGALETAPAQELQRNTYRPESSTTYELGVRSAFFEHRLGADLALFDSRRRDVQAALPVFFGEDQMFDFQRVKVRGASFNLRAAPLSDLVMTLNGTWLNWTIDEAHALAGTVFDPATHAGNAYVVGENVKRVFSLPYTPRYSASLAGDYTFLHLDRRDVMLHLDYAYRARLFTSAGSGPAVPGSQFDTQSAYGLLNGRLTISQETDWSHRLKFSLWGLNLLNRKYYQPALGQGVGVTGLNSSGSGLAGYTSRAGAWAQPRTYGLNAIYQY
jgi:iron complex outermembrane receptor protein